MGDNCGTEQQLGPWNPGLDSTLPRAYLPLSTIFRPENTTTTVQVALELADFTGLSREELSALRPERLALHELLIRIMADLSVPDGDKYEDLGINFRSMTRAIMTGYISPHLPKISSAFVDLVGRAKAILDAELSRTLYQPLPAEPQPPQKRGLLGWLRGGGHTSPPPNLAESVEATHFRLIEEWKRCAQTTDDALTRATFAALARVASAIYRRRGRILGSKETIEIVCLTLLANGYGSEIIGGMIDPYLAEAIAREGYRRLSAQSHPLVINVKGASASGKSTMRPLQRRLTQTLGVRWDEFAIISPDIWRKYLLDYASLGEARRYAGTLTGHEVAIIDKKLDRYMADKGERGQISHLLIDRFRFDSFSSDPGQEDGSRLLTRFGDIVYMYFMITPPEATVERAWKRGEQFGRYKAVDDLLDHNVEAYNGMPKLFFTWATKCDKQVHYEFLDNSVPEGAMPRTVAFGWNGEMNILDVGVLINIDRYAKINIAARSPGEVYPSGDVMAPDRNTQFLRQCARALPIVNFADFSTGRIYARLEAGSLTWCDSKALAIAMSDHEVRAGLLAVAPVLNTAMSALPTESKYLQREGAHTLGIWGEQNASGETQPSFAPSSQARI